MTILAPSNSTDESTIKQARIEVAKQKRAILGGEPTINRSEKKHDGIEAWLSMNAGTEQGVVIRVRHDDNEFNIVLSRVLQLLDEEDDFKPTEYALLATLELLVSAYQLLLVDFGRASVAVDEDGSITVYWRNLKKRVQLITPAQEHGIAYIYHQEGDNYDVDKTVSPVALAYWLKWLKLA